MKHFAYTLAVAGMVGSMGTFAAAQSDDDIDPATTTCADFLAMSAEDQRSALDTLNSADAGADSDTSASTEGSDPDADASMDTGADTSSDSATTDLSAEAETDASEVQAVIAACEGNEDDLVADQMESK